jgi:hypothetical protein
MTSYTTIPSTLHHAAMRAPGPHCYLLTYISQLGEEIEKALADYRANQSREASQCVGE